MPIIVNLFKKTIQKAWCTFGKFKNTQDCLFNLIYWLGRVDWVRLGYIKFPVAIIARIHWNHECRSTQGIYWSSVAVLLPAEAVEGRRSDTGAYVVADAHGWPEFDVLVSTVFRRYLEDWGRAAVICIGKISSGSLRCSLISIITVFFPTDSVKSSSALWRYQICIYVYVLCFAS